jgi:Trk K+ transport system NAD-binding subunit
VLRWGHAAQADYLRELSLTDDSPLLGKRWSELEKKTPKEVQLIRLIRADKAVWKPTGSPISPGSGFPST